MQWLIIFLILSFFLFLFIIFNTKESFEDMMDGHTNFCRKHQQDPVNMEKQCSTLAESNCKRSPCCNWTNNSKCMAGDATGPTFKYNSDGTMIPIDSYYYMNKCFGPKCLK